MKKSLFGIFWALVFFLLFVYLGGGRVVKWLGRETIKLGDYIIAYENVLKHKSGNIIEKVEEKGNRIKKKLQK